MNTLPYAMCAAASCALLGMFAGKRLREKEQMLHEWVCALDGLLTALENARLPLDAALKAAGLSGIARALADNPCGGAFNAFETASRAALPERAREALAIAFRALDTEVLQGQTAALRYARKRIAAQHADAEATYSRDARLYRQLGCLAAVAALILLI